VSWFDEPALYYYADRPVDWSLGDLVVAPQAILWAGEAADALAASPGLGESVHRALWRASPELVSVSAECGWDLGLIVLDDCALDRDFNREVNRCERALRAGGLGQEEANQQAVSEARAMEGLDPTLVVARVRPMTISRRRAMTRSAEPTRSATFRCSDPPTLTKASLTSTS
jgi:hypothetical protein